MPKTFGQLRAPCGGPGLPPTSLNLVLSFGNYGHSLKQHQVRTMQGGSGPLTYITLLPLSLCHQVEPLKPYDWKFLIVTYKNVLWFVRCP